MLLTGDVAPYRFVQIFSRDALPFRTVKIRLSGIGIGDENFNKLKKM